MVNPARLEGASIFFCYPFTGRPGYPDPPDWDNIPGAHGSTPQAQEFSMLCSEFKKLDVKVFGVSFQDSEWQKEFVNRTKLAISLLSDHERRFSNGLGLPTFKAGTEDFLQRITLISKEGLITHVRYPIARPENDAAETMRMMKLSTS